MIDYRPLLHWLDHQPGLRAWSQHLPDQINEGLSEARWGDRPQWQQVLMNLPAIYPSRLDFRDGVTIGRRADCSDQTRAHLQQTLMGLHPWRKGPLCLFDLEIDTEWRSDWKWQRLSPHIAPLTGRHVLDVGCGNGYYCLRMSGAGAERVIGIDPSAKFVYQFYAIKHFCAHLPVDVLPLGIEQMPPGLRGFDTVFSMGVLYHRKDYQAHIAELHGCLKPGGQLVLETLILDSGQDELLVPEGRYAKMRNVWAIPSPPRVLNWLLRAGFSDPRLVDTNRTSVREQRSTDWMRFESLSDFLNPVNPVQTVEGYPAPVRGIFVAETSR